MYLLDTGLLYELRRSKAGKADAGVTAWATRVSRQSLFISSITLVELNLAAARRFRKDKAGSQALRNWIDDQVRHAFAGRILPVDEAVAAMLERLPPIETRHGLLAATAREHGLTLVTRNTAAFKACRVKLFNPWGYSDEDAAGSGDWRHAARSGPVWLKSLFVRA